MIDPTPCSDPLDGWSLPAWTYSDPEFFELEKERVFASSWQVVCHVSDIPAAGDWHGLDYIGESVIVVRGADQHRRWQQRLREEAGLPLPRVDL
jgi:phenylpropionate dioxygenase-like ring-hydroxylating dioxygenase large terminal subunit